MAYKYFPPNLTQSPQYLVKVRCSKLLHNVEMSVQTSPDNLRISTNYLTTELAYSKLVYLAELLVVMTDWLKIVRFRARNVPRTRTQALRRRRVSLPPGM